MRVLACLRLFCKNKTMKPIKYALFGLAGVIGMLVSMFGPVKVPIAEAMAKTY